MIYCAHVFFVISKFHARLMIRLSYQPLYMPFIGQNFIGSTCYECGQLASEGGARAGRWRVGEGFWWARAVRSGLGSGADSRMAHLTLSPHISWSLCTAGGRSLLPPPFLSSQPTPAERLDFGYRRFIQLRSHLSVKLQDNVCPLWRAACEPDCRGCDAYKS